MLPLVPVPVQAQHPLAIIDMHLHAPAADEPGPPPLAMCAPAPEYAAWDPATPYGDLFIAKHKKPACADPIWSPTTEEEVMNQTLAIVERRNIVGVLSARGTRGGVGKGKPTPLHPRPDLSAR